MIIAFLHESICFHCCIPVLAAEFISMLDEVNSSDLTLYCGPHCTLWYSSESGKDCQELPATQSLQQSSKLGAVANVLPDLVTGGRQAFHASRTVSLLKHHSDEIWGKKQRYTWYQLPFGTEWLHQDLWWWLNHWWGSGLLSAYEMSLSYQLLHTNTTCMETDM